MSGIWSEYDFIDFPTTVFIDPGRPLDEDDFYLASQLARRNQNSSSDAMMRPPLQLSMEQLEALGEKYVKKLNKEQRNILASVR